MSLVLLVSLDQLVLLVRLLPDQLVRLALLVLLVQPVPPVQLVKLVLA